MELENKLRKDLWKAVQAHFERKDYTEAVRDALYHVCDVIRDKSGVEDKDGTKLIDDTLLGKSPVLLVNKNETTTEKDIQQGIGFAFKGLMQSIRNPLSHEPISYSDSDAEAIILFINYLLNQIDKNPQISIVDDVKELLYDEDFINTEEYAKCLIKEIPIKKRYDLLISIYNDRKNLPLNTLNFFISELISSISKSSFDDFVRIVSKSLIRCKNDRSLVAYLSYFMWKTYKYIDKLAKLRIESIIEKSLSNGRMDNTYMPYTSQVRRECNSDGVVATWARGNFGQFESRERLISLMISKIEKNEDEAEYVYKFFPYDFIDENHSFSAYEESVIKKQLLSGSYEMFQAFSNHVNYPYEEKNKLNSMFGAELRKCHEIVAKDIPF